MVIVDTHCHISPHWYEPVESLLFQMDQNGVEQAVLIQYMGQYNNEYQFECEERFPGRFASVVLVDINDHKAPEQLERLAKRGARGVRLRPDDPLAIWRKAEELGLVISCAGTGAGFASEEFSNVIQSFPDLTIILEHLGSIKKPDGKDAPYEICSKVFGLSRFPNVCIKIPGLGEFCRRNTPVTEPFPFKTPIPPLLEMAYESFGPERMMWGSDYPPVSGREGYANSLRFTLEQFGAKSQSDMEPIFGGVAKKVFRL